MLKMDRGTAPREKVVFKSDARKVSMRTPKTFSTSNMDKKVNQPENIKYKYDEDVERKLEELMNKLQGPQLTNSQIGLDAWSDVDENIGYPRMAKRLLDNSRERQNVPKSQEKKNSQRSKQPFLDMPPQKAQLLGAKRPVSRLNPIAGQAQINPSSAAARRAAVQSNQGSRAPAMYASPARQVQKVVAPPPQILPKIFTKLPQNDLQGPKYKIKWFAPDSAFKGKSIDLKLGEVLGKGAFATVYEAFDEVTNRSVAVKIFDKRMLKDASKRKEVQAELNLVGKLNHSSVIQLVRMVEDQDKVYIVMDNWGKITLENYLKDGLLKRSELKLLFGQLVDAVQYLHAHNVFHRDIKLTNIMIQKSQICLLDFGLATNSQYACEFLYCGTLTYMAPEILAKQGYQGAPVDVWALGVCLFRLLTQKYPFGGRFVLLISRPPRP